MTMDFSSVNSALILLVWVSGLAIVLTTWSYARWAAKTTIKKTSTILCSEPYNCLLFFGATLFTLGVYISLTNPTARSFSLVFFLYFLFEFCQSIYHQVRSHKNKA